MDSRGFHRIPLAMGIRMLFRMRTGWEWEERFHNGIPILVTLFPIFTFYARKIKVSKDKDWLYNQCIVKQHTPVVHFSFPLCRPIS